MAPIEIFDDDQEQAAHLAETEQKKTKQSRRPQKSRKVSEETPAEAKSASEEGSPKKRTLSRKKNMPVDTKAAQSATEITEVPENASQPAKPTRKRRSTRKTATAEHSESSENAEPERFSLPEKSIPEKQETPPTPRKRRTRSPKKSSEEIQQGTLITTDPLKLLEKVAKESKSAPLSKTSALLPTTRQSMAVSTLNGSAKPGENRPPVLDNFSFTPPSSVNPQPDQETLSEDIATPQPVPAQNALSEEIAMPEFVLLEPAQPKAMPKEEAEGTDPSQKPLEESEGKSPRPRSRSARRRAAVVRRKAEAKAAEAARLAKRTEKKDSLVELEGDTEAARQPSANHKMLVSVLPGELAEVVFLEDDTVAEYYVEMVHQAKIRGNIYKGIISNIDPNLQAAFVNFGQSKNGFLQIDEIHPEYWLAHYELENGNKYPPIQKVMKAGQEVLVQVVKEPNGSKGAFLTTWVSLAGRFLVLTPGQEQIGISRKVEDYEERSRLRELIKGLDPGEGVGAIVRTVSEGTSKATLQKDLNFLKRVWNDIRTRAGTEKAPSLIYAEPGLASRAVRDYLSDDVSEIWVDDATTAESIRSMTSLLFPHRPELVHYYGKNSKSLWDHFNVRKQLDQIHAREVTLPSGGRLVFDQTEALMAIDINSGKSGGKNNFEATALRTNLEAAESIARQLRLRDVGGQVVIDFIEMHDQGRCREVEKTLYTAMKKDRARHDIGHMSSFGLLQIVRQRIGSSAISISQEPCPHCSGTGMRRNLEWQALQLLRELRGELTLVSRNGRNEHICLLNAELALYMLNNKRERLSSLEKEFNIRLEIRIAKDGGE